MNLTHTPGPLAWQKFGNEYCLTGRYGMRPIVLSTTPKGQLRLLKDGLLVPFDPKHPDARVLAAAHDLLPALEAILEAHCCDTGEAGYTCTWSEDGTHTTCPVCIPAYAAIAKAKGLS